jgi:hypothetical protein
MTTNNLRALAVLTLLFALAAIWAHPAHAAAFTVESRGDQPDADLTNAACDVDAATAGEQCTLRAAIGEANDTPGADTIGFDIPGSGVQTIAPASGLPPITGPVTIDGYSQAGASANTKRVGNNSVLKIELSGENAGTSADGLDVRASDSVIKGLAVNRFRLGIVVSGVGVTGTGIEGNFVGTDASGTRSNDASGNWLGNTLAGVRVGGENNVVGGTMPRARNVLSNNAMGVHVMSQGVSGNRVEGNYIGTDKSGTRALSNGWGVQLDFGSNNTVGGTVPSAANTIAFNNSNGVELISAGFTTSGNRILRNAIFSNAGLGIDLGGDGPTANDPDDADGGANNGQNFPVLTSATSSRRGTAVRGTLDSTRNTTFTVQLYANPAGEDEGKKYLGQKTGVTTDDDGDASFAFKTRKRIGGQITATAIKDPTGDTSEFSPPKKVVRR